MASGGDRPKCVRCDGYRRRVVDPNICECGSRAFYVGKPLGWFPLRFEGEDPRFLFARIPGARNVSRVAWTLF